MKKFDKYNRAKRRKTQIASFSEELLNKVLDYGDITNKSPNESLKTLLDESMPYMSYLNYNICSALPYSIRLAIIDYLSVVSSRFAFHKKVCKPRRSSKKKKRKKTLIHSYALQRDCSMHEYISLMYGYFNQDTSRRIYLVFGYVVFNLRKKSVIECLPIKQLRQVYFVAGSVTSFSPVPSHLRNLCFSNFSTTSELLLPLLRRLKHLTKFAVKGLHCVHRNTSILQELRRVRTLRLMDCSLDDMDVEKLVSGEHVRIRVLNVCENRGIQGHGFFGLNQNCSVQVLSLDDTDMTDEYLKKLNLRNIRHVEMNATDCSIEAIAYMITKNVVSIEAGSRDYVADMTDMQQMHRSFLSSKQTFTQSALDSLSLDNCRIPSSFFNIVAQLSNLRYLSLSMCGLKNDDITRIFQNRNKIVKFHASFNALLVPSRILPLLVHLEHFEFCQGLNFCNRDLEYIFTRFKNIRFLWVEGISLSNKGLMKMSKCRTLNHFWVTGRNRIDEVGRLLVKNCKNVLEMKWQEQALLETDGVVRCWYKR